MTARGIAGKAQEEILQGITSFALYGFPESHAASFALIAYASAYLKAHHPTAFLIALLNAWPMGFYHPATLVQDAKRHGVARAADRRQPLGLEVPLGGGRRAGWACASCSGLRAGAGRAIGEERRAAARTRAPRTWPGAPACGRTSSPPSPPLGALASLGLTRREALWQVAAGRAAPPARCSRTSRTRPRRRSPR